MALQTVEAFEELGYSVIELVIIKMDGKGHTLFRCYVTAGTFARRGLSSTAKTLRSLSGVRGSEY